MRKDNIINAFFALVRAGLWEKEVKLASLGQLDFSRILSLSEEQSIVGLVAAGMEHVTDVKLPKEDVLQFVGQALQLEQQNMSMNRFISDLVEKMRKVGIYTLLVKGQGIAQCYDRPLWRSCGDVDFFLSDTNYEAAKAFLSPLASSIETEGEYKKHFGMTIDTWVVELHGNLRCGLSSRMDKVIGEIQNDVFFGGDVRSWDNQGMQVFLPGVNCDVLFVFTHFLKHFYCGGLGMRQICDWCRLLWTYRDTIDRNRLENKLNKMGLVSEWKAFGAFAVEWLGMPAEAMPLYSTEKRWKMKAKKICSFVLEVGNFGHNRDVSRYQNKTYFVRKLMSFGRRLGDLCRHARIFPLDSLRFFPSIVINGLKSAANGE